MTHPTLTAESIADTLAALDRIKAGDGGAPGLEPRHERNLRRFLDDLLVPDDLYHDALAHLLDVCMGVMGWASLVGNWYIAIEFAVGGKGMLWRIETSVGNTVADGECDTHLSAACAVVRAIAGVVGEKEGGSDE